MQMLRIIWATMLHLQRILNLLHTLLKYFWASIQGLHSPSDLPTPSMCQTLCIMLSCVANKQSLPTETSHIFTFIVLNSGGYVLYSSICSAKLKEASSLFPLCAVAFNQPANIRLVFNQETMDSYSRIFSTIRDESIEITEASDGVETFTAKEIFHTIRWKPWWQYHSLAMLIPIL
ncbi:hypothetical protein H5410_035529 [Solanum commersonii]|uniref:Uncharacterized protein n=1 Tax=Solanum commersonii TaxID=4109 RepID=A0A9J5Y1I7_SOLCO|nr:hypothetical protein H5410_035529 [Solanum commersonii]